MGRRDYRHREPKKSKKDAKKAPPLSEVLAPTVVKVVPRKRKEGMSPESEEARR